MKLDPPKNANYAAVVIQVNHLEDLGLNTLVGVPVLGHQALTTKGVEVGDLRVAFTAETQLSEEYAAHNNLFRHAHLNMDPTETGYLDDNVRVKAIKFAGKRSDALLMPLESLAYTGVDVTQLKPGDTFDRLDGFDICRKYEIKLSNGRVAGAAKIVRAFKRVDKTVFPEHLDTDNYFRNLHLIKGDKTVIVTQKVHGTSWRGGNVPVKRELKFRERVAKRLGVKVSDWEYDVVFGSRKVIKDVNNPRQQHFYTTDIWTEYGAKVADLIPEGYMVYGELVGWTSSGSPLQAGYTYDLPQGESQLYVYRVAHINRHGNLSDLSWDGVKHFCQERGLKWVPELDRVGPCANLAEEVAQVVSDTLDVRLAEVGTATWSEPPVRLSGAKTVDEGVCLRIDGLVPLILKAKSGKFLEHETKMLDKGEPDLESSEGVA